MVGLNRLDDLQACVEQVVRDGVPGDLIETGTWRGGASLLMRATLDSLGAGDRTVVLADSFQGFRPTTIRVTSTRPTSWRRRVRGRGGFARLGLDGGVRFVPGFFEETLPRLAGERWSVVRLDGDTYEATWLALESLYPTLAPGGHLIVDDYRVVPECARAVDEFRERHGIREPLHDVDWTCVRWRREDDCADRLDPPAARPRPDSRLRTLERRERAARADRAARSSSSASWRQCAPSSSVSGASAPHPGGRLRRKPR